MNHQSSESQADEDLTILLFDGVCNLCAGLVKTLIPLDPHGRLRFASLQSPTGSHLRNVFGIPDDVDSMVAIVGGRAYTRSDGVLAVGRGLGGKYRALAGLIRLLPRPVRDAGYKYLANHRFRWFGQRDECWLPTPELKARFLADG